MPTCHSSTLSSSWGNVPEFPELGACLGVQYGLHRFFDGLPGPGRPYFRLAHQDFVGHLLDASIVAHGALPFLAETLPKVSITLPGFSGPTDRGCAAFKGRGRPLGRLLAYRGGAMQLLYSPIYTPIDSASS